MSGRRSEGGSVILLSGGMDSATALAVVARRHRTVDALTFLYGQRHEREVRSARAIARYFRVDEHRVIRLPIKELLPSALTRSRSRLPKSEPLGGRIPSTYVPARNTILLALALAYAEGRGLSQIVYGANAIDYSGYPDCRPEYIAAFNRTARNGTRAGVEDGSAPQVVAPLVHLSKAQIVHLGERLSVPWELTWSCYRGGRRPCGRCDACRLRAKGFLEAGITDPLLDARR